MDINTKINMCIDINIALGPDAYDVEVAKHMKYCSYTNRYVPCTRLLDVPDEVVIRLHSELVSV